MKYQLATLVVVSAISLCSAALDRSVCVRGGLKPTSGVTPKDFPAIPDVFSARIQMNVAINKTVRSLYEIFDAPNSRAIIQETEATGDYKNISLTGRDMYNFYGNQIVEIIDLPDGSTYCDASQLDGKGADTFIFGDKASSSSGFNAASAFMVSTDFPPVYQGTETLDTGVEVESWLDCHYILALDATVTAQWYFTVPTWSTAVGGNHQVPVMLKVKGKLYANNPSGRTVDHTYTFSGFRDFLTDSLEDYFMVPQGVVCPHLKGFDVNAPTPHNIPPIAQDGFFSFKGEYIQKVDTTSGLITDIKEYYDNNFQLSRFDYVPQGFITAFFDGGSDNPITEIHDFVSGLAYVIDAQRGNCTIMALSEGNRFDIINADNNHIRMKTVKEFFGLDDKTQGSSMNWTYTGRRRLRNIMADVYIAEKIGYPNGDTKSIWELAFTSPEYLDVNSDSSGIEVQEPIRMWIKIPDLDYEMTYNIFEFNEDEPDTFLFDVSNCYTDDQITSVSFKIPGDQRDLIEDNKIEFKYWMLTDITGYLGIATARVSGLEWTADDDDSNLIVRFKILDPPTVTTNDALPDEYTKSSADAISDLKSVVDGGKFVIEAGSVGDGSISPVTAIKGSVLKGKVETKTKTVVKLDSGAAAGLAIAFLAIGVGLGVLIIFVINKVRGGSLPNLSMSFSPKTFQNES